MTIETITKAEYARRRGCGRSAVTKAVQEGRITTTADGRINPKRADREWEANSRARTDIRASRRAAPATSASKTASAPSDLEENVSKPDSSLGAARARREHAEAQRAEIELAQLRGSVVDGATVERERFTSARVVRDRLMNLPTRIAPLLAPIVDAFELERQLREAIRAALNECLGAIVDGTA